MAVDLRLGWGCHLASQVIDLCIVRHPGPHMVSRLHVGLAEPLQHERAQRRRQLRVLTPLLNKHITGIRTEGLDYMDFDLKPDN